MIIRQQSFTVPQAPPAGYEPGLIELLTQSSLCASFNICQPSARAQTTHSHSPAAVISCSKQMAPPIAASPNAM